MKNVKLLMWIVVVIITFTACPNKKDEPTTDDSEQELRDSLLQVKAQTFLVNEWVNDVMEEVYYWNNYIPSSLTPDSTTDPEDFFEEHLYSSDKWSYITSDYEALSGELSGEPVSMGYSPYFTLVSDEQVIIIVEYVYPDSPADKAGLERGDVILTINEKELTIDNYYTLYSGSSYTAGIGFITNSTGSFSIIDAGKTISMTAEVIEADPVLYSDILEISNKKIGYLVYVSYTSGDSDQYLTSLGNAISAMAQEGIDDLIVDLRYNSGGELYAAQFLTSAIAPASVVNAGEILVNLDYNDLYNEYFEAYYPEELYYTFEPNKYNLDMSKVYFLTAGYTASASELTIIGLEPYMDVITVGEYTYGKYTGMWVIPDTEEPARHNYAMMPVVMKYENANGYTDFADGLTPDYEIDDDGLLLGVPFGDLEDPILAKAVEDITGLKSARTTNTFSSRPELVPLVSKKMDRKMNLIVPSELK